MKYIPILALVCVLFVPSITEASPIIRSGEKVSVDEDQVLEGDFYGAGESVTISGVAEHDVLVAGSNVTFDGSASGDIAAAGATVNINGTVDDDVRVAGGDIKVAGTIEGDLVVAGANLTILSKARIGGDLIFWGGELTLEGEVVGSLHGTADVLRIDGPVGDDVEFTVRNRFELGEKAQIEGDIIYSGVELNRSQNAVVVGVVQYGGSTFEGENRSRAEVFVFTFLIILFSALSIFFIARTQVHALVTQSTLRFGFNGLIGIAALIVTPFVTILLMVSMVGLITGFVLLFAYFVMLLLALILSVVMLGYLFESVILKRQSFTSLTPFIGSLIFVLLLYLPVLGTLILLASILVSLGAIVNSIYHTLRT